MFVPLCLREMIKTNSFVHIYNGVGHLNHCKQVIFNPRSQFCSITDIENNEGKSVKS